MRQRPTTPSVKLHNIHDSYRNTGIPSTLHRRAVVICFWAHFFPSAWPLAYVVDAPDGEVYLASPDPDSSIVSGFQALISYIV